MKIFFISIFFVFLSSFLFYGAEKSTYNPDDHGEYDKNE